MEIMYTSIQNDRRRYEDPIKVEREKREERKEREERENERNLLISRTIRS